jgi:hypothetical protein
MLLPFLLRHLLLLMLRHLLRHLRPLLLHHLLLLLLLRHLLRYLLRYLLPLLLLGPAAGSCPRSTSSEPCGGSAFSWGRRWVSGWQTLRSTRRTSRSRCSSWPVPG